MAYLALYPQNLLPNSVTIETPVLGSPGRGNPLSSYGQPRPALPTVSIQPLESARVIPGYMLGKQSLYALHPTQALSLAVLES